MWFRKGKGLKPVVFSILFVLLLSGFFLVRQGSILYSIDKSLSIFGEMFRIITLYYVDPVDPERFVQEGMENMLEYLDPYTQYVPAEEQSSIDVLTTGRYAGLGITIGRIDSSLVILEVMEGYGAHRAGLQRGDILYKINSVVVQHLQPEDLKPYTFGEPGTTVQLVVLRGVPPDTLTFQVQREEIALKSVTYAGFVDSGIGYIRLERFSQSAPHEFKQAFEKLRSRGQLRGLILDLRGNPGGLLESAVSIVEFFVPRGSLIVSTRGRDSSDWKNYYSDGEPIDTALPLAVLIDSGSASASEIVAGALQDLDRAVIVGRRSFGKGLVQSVFALPYHGRLKVTTARYYTPSGRCIQRIDYSQKRMKILKADSSAHQIFYTDHGRPVEELNGITPDTVILESHQSRFVRSMHQQRLFFRFANSVLSQHPEVVTRKDTTALLQLFVHFLKQQHTVDHHQLPYLLLQAYHIAEQEQYSDSLRAALRRLQHQAAEEIEHLVVVHREKIVEKLWQELSLRLLSKEEYFAQQLQSDKDVEVAGRILQSPLVYRNILAGTMDN